jgi:uncharacterized membrane protein YphA (DoxX/SURF4 family)
MRLVSGTILIHDGLAGLLQAPQWEGITRPSLAIGAGILLLVGLWTPIAGVLVVMIEVWTALSRADGLRMCAVLATLGAALAMLGPGLRSLDARLYGRKQIDIGEL